MATVVLDAGHDGCDVGAVNGTRQEKNDSQRAARAVGDILTANGINAVYTRGGEEYISLGQRVSAANSTPADMFLSFHRGCSSNPDMNGLEAFVTSAATARSREWANNVYNAAAGTNVFANLGLKEADYYVLKNTHMPAMLLNLGFITNTGDNEKLDANFGRLTRSIADAVIGNLTASPRTQGQASAPDPAQQPAGVPQNPAPAQMPYVPMDISTPTTTDTAPYYAYTPIPETEEIRPVPAATKQTFATRTDIPQTSAISPASANATHSSRVRTVQQELNSRYHQNIAADGLAGVKTKAALANALQMALNADGRTYPPLTRMGDRGDIVFLLQSALVANGYDIAADGIFGKRTKAALIDFQQKRYLLPDGIAGPATFARLFN